MALRLGPQNPMPDQPPQAEPEDPTQGNLQSDTQDSETEIDQDEVGLPKILPGPAGYIGPEGGPFKCGNCLYFEPEGACHIVAGPIMAEGCCNLFVKGSPLSGSQGQPGAPIPEEEPAPAAPGNES